MSSGFISAGTNEQPIERDDEWLKAQHELDEERRRKAEVGKQNDGKSLFEVLERNKSESQSGCPASLYSLYSWIESGQFIRNIG